PSPTRKSRRRKSNARRPNSKRRPRFGKSKNGNRSGKTWRNSYGDIWSGPATWTRIGKHETYSVPPALSARHALPCRRAPRRRGTADLGELGPGRDLRGAIGRLSR